MNKFHLLICIVAAVGIAVSTVLIADWLVRI